jgi:hypothetical protein
MEEGHHAILEAGVETENFPMGFLVVAEAEEDQAWHWMRHVAGLVQSQAEQIYQHLQLAVVLGILVEVVKVLEVEEEEEQEEQELQVLAALGMRLVVGAMEAAVEEDRVDHHCLQYSGD